MYCRIGNITVDLLLVVTFWAGLSFGRSSGMLMGAVCGLVADMCSHALLGTNVLSKLLVGYIAGGLHKRMSCKDIVPSFFMLGSFSILDSSLVCATLLISNFSFNIGETFLSIILPQALLNAAVGTMFIGFILKLDSLMWGDIFRRNQGYKMDHLF